MRTTMRLSSLFKWVIGILLFDIFLLLAIVAHLSFKDYSDYFQSHHGSLSNIVTRSGSAPGKYWITLQNTDGFTVDCGLLVPNVINTASYNISSPSNRSREKGSLEKTKLLSSNNTVSRYPAIVLLGGKATGKYAVDYAFDIDNIIILALDYPYEPRESYNFWTIVQDIPAVRQTFFDMVPATMLALDYLFQRPDVDTNKIVLLGYSFGAPFVPVIATTDRRISVAAMVYGGGELYSMIRHNVARHKGPLLSEFVGGLGGGLLLRPLEPMRYVDKISPTPLVMINGKNDEQVPRYNTELFFNAAHEPKKLVWLESKHVNTNNPDLTRLIIATLKEELKRLKIL